MDDILPTELLPNLDAPAPERGGDLTPIAHDLPGQVGSILPRARPTSPPVGVSLTGSLGPTIPCPRCDGAGYYKEAVPFGHPHFGKLFPCACKLAAREQHAKQQQQARLNQLAGIAGRYASATFDSFVTDRAYPGPVEWYDLTKLDTRYWYGPKAQAQSTARAVAAARAYAAAPRGGLLLEGPYGSGKTHLAYAVAHELARRGHTIAADSLPALLQFIRDGFADRSAGQRLRDLKTVDLLILDDVGAEYETDWTAEQVYAVINHRYVFDLWTICTSNLPVAYLPGRIGSRIAEFAQVAPLIAYDYRLLQAGRRTA